MKKLKKTGIQITESDGSALVSGNFHYWDAELSNVVMTDLSEFCPDVIYKPAEHSAGAFTALFYRNSSSGVELCSTSKSLEENKTTIPAKELDKFIACLDRLHQRSEQPNIPSDTRDFIKSLRIPSPWRMKSAWRVSTGFTRHLFVLWGYSSSDSEATILPLTPTSAKWADAGDRVDLHKQLKKSVSKSSLNWGKILKWLLCIFLVLLLIGLVFSLLKYKTLSGSVNVLNNIGSRIVAIFYSPKCPECHGRLDQNGKCSKLCDECGAHKNKNGECPELCVVCGTHKSNGVCPNTCTIHKKHFVDGQCPSVCPKCNRHLDADGKCPELCEKHPNQHKQNGVCPLCNANKPSVGPIAINNKTCPICHGQLDQNGKCPQLCIKCGEHKNNGVCPNICLIHNKHLENGKCPLCQETRSEVTDKTCPICHGPLDRYGKCPQQCKVCGRHKHNGKCPQLCEVCGKHKRNGTCPNVCNTHGNHLQADGTCPRLCPECRRHLNADGKCPEHCGVCGTHKRNGVCPRLCPECHRHLNADGKCPELCGVCGTHKRNGVCPRLCPKCHRHLNADGKCPEVCEQHPDQHKWNGVCPLCEIRINKSPTCPICHGQMDQNGKCPQLCKECGKHKNNGVCPNLCTIHNKHYVNGNCPMRCQDPGCRRHLDKDGKCPGVCAKHPEQHKRNGLCPVCDSIIQEMDFFIEIKTETQKEGLYYPVFRIKNAIQAKPVSIDWKLDGKPTGQQPEFTPQEGFSAGERHEIEAEITYYHDGKQEKYRTQPFVWQKNVDPTIVERHISLIGQHHTDATGDYYILKVCSNPEQSMTIKSWTIEMENYGRIKTGSSTNFGGGIQYKGQCIILCDQVLISCVMRLI